VSTGAAGVHTKLARFSNTTFTVTCCDGTMTANHGSLLVVDDDQAASHGARRARYRGLPKTRLDHAYMACALNLLRLHAYWTGTPLDRKRTSHLARLELSLAALPGISHQDHPGS